MSTGPPAPRRLPKQDRSRAAVEAIREAGRRILTTEGPQALTTNRIAERAGVSIGSLYHYYPNRDSILSDLFEERMQEVLAEIDALRDSVRLEDLPLERSLETLVDMAFAESARLAGMHREFLVTFGRQFEIGNRIAPNGRTYHQQLVDILQELLRRNRDAVELDDIDAAAAALALLLDGFNRATREERLPAAPEKLRPGLVRAMLGYLGVREPWTATFTAQAGSSSSPSSARARPLP